MTQQEHQRYTSRIADYVLGLLPDLEQQTIEQHAAACADCRAAISAERQIVFSIHNTLAATRLPSAAHLAGLMPAPPVRKQQQTMATTWQRGFAIATLVLFLWMGNFGWQRFTLGIVEASPVATQTAATATTPPTATIIQQVAQATALPPSRQPVIPTLELTPVVTQFSQ